MAEVGGVVVSILEPDVGSALRRLERLPSGYDLVEIRADTLSPEEVTALVRRALRPAIVTVRSTGQGGRFEGSAEEQWARLRAGLAAGAAFVDIELDGPLARLAWGPHARRLILSHHGARAEDGELLGLYRAMASTPAARLKIVPRVERPREIAAVRHLLEVARSEGRPLACFGLGAAGQPTRIFALSWGSWATYAAPERGSETAEGQLSLDELLEVYRVRAVGPGTRRFALVGAGVTGSPSPAMHAAGYAEVGLDAVYVPVEASALEDVEVLLAPEGPLGVEGFGVTIPLKEEVARRSHLADEVSRRARAVNTVLVREGSWIGYNTDGPGAAGLLRRVLDLAGARVAIVGSGGTARGIGAALALEGAEVVLFGRSAGRTEDAARAIGARSAPLASLPQFRWDVLVNATPLGRQGERLVPPDALRGRAVVDAVYGPGQTLLVREAREAGLAVFDGLDLLAAQGRLQFERMTGAAASEQRLRLAARKRLLS